MTTMYKQAVAAHLRDLSDLGHTQLEMAHLLGTAKGNLISMIMNPKRPERLAAKRLPALERACKLTAKECVRLFILHTREYPEGCALNEETAVWFLRKTQQALLEARRPHA